MEIKGLAGADYPRLCFHHLPDIENRCFPEQLTNEEGKIKIFAILKSNYSLFSRAGYYQGRFRGSYFKLFVANFFFSLQFI